MEQSKNKQPKVEPTQPIEQPKQKSVKSKGVGQAVTNVANLMLYGAVIVVMGVGLLWAFNGASQSLSTAQEPTTESTPVAEMTIEAVITMVNGYCDSGDIKGQGLCNSLLSKLEAAIEARDRGQPDVACNQLNAFINEVAAQNENKIPADVATELIDAAGLACSKLPPTVEPSATPIAEISPSPTSIPNTPTLTPHPNLVTTVELPGGSYRIYDSPIITGTPYTPTSVVIPTPTFVPSIQVVSKQQLSLNGISLDDTNILIKEWTEDGLIVQTGFIKGNEEFLIISVDTGGTQELTNYEPLYPSQIAKDTIGELKEFNPEIWFTSISPDEQWVAGASTFELLVKQVGTNQPPITLLSSSIDNGDFANFLAWSPSSQLLAYAIYTGQYEIHISNIDGSDAQVINLSYGEPSMITWSLNEHFIAFNCREEPQQITDLCVAKTDGTTLVNVTDDEVWVTGPISWSPDSRKISYSDTNNKIWIIEIGDK